jgi:hypothetical protein
MGGVLAAVWMIAVVLYGISQFAVAFLGVDYYWGGLAAGVVIGASLFFRFTLPITIASFLGAYVVLGWPWYGALLFAVPGLAFMFGFAILQGGAALLSSRANRSSR